MDISVAKGGAGAHNWGSINSEYYHENATIVDEVEELKTKLQEVEVSAYFYDVPLRSRLNMMETSSTSLHPPNPLQRSLRCASYERHHRRGLRERLEE